jgi:hypothetical protein
MHTLFRLESTLMANQDESLGESAGQPQRSDGQRFRSVYVLLLVLIVSFTASALSMMRMSPSFDEIVLVAGGARGWETGHFDLAPDHPPLLQYVYGLPVFLSGPEYPEVEADLATRQSLFYRYQYSQEFYFESGNHPEKIAFLGRLPALALAGLLVFATFRLTRRRFGDFAGLTAATMVAFLPDVLAHGGIAYTDLPATLGYLVGLYVLDGVIRAPTLVRAGQAGVVAGLAVGAKITAVALGPAALALLVMETVRRRSDPTWSKDVRIAAVVTILAAYLTLVAIFLGDFALSEFRYGLEYRVGHFMAGHGAPAFLLGQMSGDGWWYFFPVAFFLKTSVALHLLMGLAAVALVRSCRGKSRETLLDSQLRAPLMGIAVYGAVLLYSNLNIGFRYAMPVLPLIAIVTAVGVARLWQSRSRGLRTAILVALGWLIIQPLSYAPNFIAYISEYGPGRDRNHEVLLDSSLDWGQGLLNLREFMRERDIGCIRLAYFGSGRPGAYGIEYQPLQSFLPLPENVCDSPPEWTVVSASMLYGAYTGDDPFGALRATPPDAVIGHTMLAWQDRP